MILVEVTQDETFIKMDDQLGDYRTRMQERWKKRSPPFVVPAATTNGSKTSRTGGGGGRVGYSEHNAERRMLTIAELKSKMDVEYYIHYPPKPSSETLKTVIIDRESIMSIVNYVSKSTNPRRGYLYGVTDKNGTEMTIDTIYEPPQNMKTSILLEDLRKERVNELVKLVGMQSLGLISTNKDGLMTAQDVWYLLSKKLGTISVVVRPTGEVVAYQLSKQCVELYDKKILIGVKNEKIQTKSKVSINGKETDEIEPERLYVPLAIKERVENDVIDNYFHRLNRPEHFPIWQDVSNFLNGRKSLPLHQRFADFHLLMFLSDWFEVDAIVLGIFQQDDELIEPTMKIVKKFIERI